MAKKKQAKKHNFKHVTPTPTGREAVTVDASPAKAAAKTVATPAGPSYAYVGHDMTKVAVLAGSLVALEMILWLLFGHTGLGNSVYNLVKV